jgi:dTMP kinase
MKNKKKGLFIVFDGTDGSGKTTQTRLLIKKLNNKGYEVREIDFPQYGKKSAVLVEEYLNGEFGTAKEVGPYRASIFFACDRYGSRKKILGWISEGNIVLANRYVAANMGHQGGKIADKNIRKEYFKWLFDLEYNVFSAPKPDINLILHVDAAIAQKLAQKKRKGYIKKGKKDIHENDLKHLRDAENVYLEIAKTFPDFSLIECMKKGGIMNRNEISDLIWNKLKRRLE